MKTNPQVRLANEMALQFRGQPAERAGAAIAHHIRQFWDPRMRADLLRRVADNPSDVDPLVLAAVPHLS
ncbi:formate dehydrogenase subunit delta [Amycolatopsis sp. 195334CR]|uniref:formate dehydrogenase subunit delta n=1 Tax=Amycolatopsis sp. 195334CR TaxID=2814588 RepID=UPI001A8EF230|nr:formate dehydrogenase subunit delta [Amycolatopsis sp. 195334CR]MBN6040529.1 formate dehydrogenase subunit delta [Amycolatopsis sp. 195334CR]